MGSWNKTCGISNLHIYAGTPVYVFVLQENPNKTDRCYSTAFWRPLLLPFESVYNDYGGGEDSSGPGFEYIMQGVANSLKEMEQGKNEYHDIPVKKEGFGEEEFFNAVHESRLMDKDSRLIDFVMMRKDVVDNILDSQIIEEYVGEGKGNTGHNNCYIKYKFKDIIDDVPKFLDMIEHILDGLKNLPVDKIMFLVRLDTLCDYGHPNKVGGHLQTDSYRYSRIVDVNTLIVSLMIAGKRDEATILLTELLKGVYINDFMECTRHNWSPGGHEGSQNDDRDSYIVLINAIRSAIEAEEKEFGENDD